MSNVLVFLVAIISIFLLFRFQSRTVNVEQNHSHIQEIDKKKIK
jgi:hypothetical protein